MARVSLTDICRESNLASLHTAITLEVDEHGKAKMCVLLIFLMRTWKMCEWDPQEPTPGVW